MIRPGVHVRSRAGFSLMELLTIMIVVSILAAIAIPRLRHATARADARKVLTDVHAIRVGLLEFREEEDGLPGTAAWGTIPPDLEAFLNNVQFTYKDADYRLRSNARRGRVDLIVRYPRGSPLGDALGPFARPGNGSGSVTWTRRRMRFRLLENGE